MAIFSLIFGVVAFVASLLPGCSYMFLVMCCFGLTGGVVAIVEHKGDRGTAVAGVILNGYATVLILLWTVFFAIGTIEAANDAIATDNAVMTQPLPTQLGPRLQTVPAPAKNMAK